MTADTILDDIHKRSSYYLATEKQARAKADENKERYGGEYFVVKDHGEYVVVNRTRLDGEYPGAKILYSTDQETRA